ncbi:hypothetical protein [Caulobacter endophyticus]|uniref:hypothetical protein n=1 Tax=Caulobacter endophyticus TaxID=2172652 RepID=UPI00241098C9|nr:hypothetical protein [Caulobacter endophyticus]MDG2530638.1 hypothetical protein [Caulobacter endophyticus]
MRAILTILALLALSGCSRVEADTPAAQREAVTRACLEGKLVPFGLKLDRVGCACASNVLQAQLSPKAMTALEDYARGRKDGFESARAGLGGDEKLMLDPERSSGSPDLRKVAADCL